MNWRAGKVLKKIGLDPRIFFDSQLTVFLKKPMFDTAKFDNYLHSKFGNYEENGKSMADIIHEHFPQYEEELKNIFS